MLLPHPCQPQPTSSRLLQLCSISSQSSSSPCWWLWPSLLSQRVRRSVWLVGQLLDRPHQLILFQDLILVFAPFYHQLSNYGVQRDILLKSFSTQVMWPALPMATPQPPIQRTLQARPFLTTRSPPHHTVTTMLCHTIPYHTIPQYHQVSTCTPISQFSCPGLPSACSSTSSCFSFKGRSCKLFCNPSSLLEDD